MEINSLKNVTLRLTQILKTNSVSVPGFATNANLKLNDPETGLREGEAEKENERDWLDANSIGTSNLSMGGFEEGEAGEQQKIEWLTE